MISICCKIELKDPLLYSAQPLLLFSCCLQRKRSLMKFEETKSSQELWKGVAGEEGRLN